MDPSVRFSYENNGVNHHSNCDMREAVQFARRAQKAAKRAALAAGKTAPTERSQSRGRTVRAVAALKRFVVHAPRPANSVQR